MSECMKRDVPLTYKRITARACGAKSLHGIRNTFLEELERASVAAICSHLRTNKILRKLVMVE